ncbi:MAG: NAD(P)-binding protein [Steroidobacteraceae bacterium]|jgi:spermidine dehydrogenase
MNKDGITRRDFVNGIAIAIAGVSGIEIRPAASAEPTATTPLPAKTGDYPPARGGLRGSHIGSFEAAHRLRDGTPFDLSGSVVSEHYDLIIVGGGLSGLAGAYFYRQHRPHARILILDTNDDFGGHAKRNEFEVDGKTIIGYGGTQSIDSPESRYSPVCKRLLRDLGIELRRFDKDFDQSFNKRWGLKQAIFFKKEMFGVDRLVRRPYSTWTEWTDEGTDESELRAYIGELPLSERARTQLFEMCWSERDVLAGHTAAQRSAILEHISYSDFLRKYWDADQDVLKYLQTRTHDLWAIGIDAVPASETLYLPGLKAQRKAIAGPAGGAEEEPYIYHFPDGNASIARLLVRKLIPGAAPGSTMDDIVLARFDYGQLDLAEHAVRIRLGATAVDVRNVGAGVEVAYVKDGTVTRVAAGGCVLACYHAMIPYIAPQTSEKQRKALHANVRAPLVYVNVIARNWEPWRKLGVAFIDNPGGTFAAYLDFPVSMDGYRFSSDPAQPICIHMFHAPTVPNQGLNMREQFRAGRGRLYTTSFADFEREIRDELGRMLAPAGFDFDRDIAAITVNRWPHGYAYTPTPLFDDPIEQRKIERAARQRVGRITIANSDSGWDAYTNVAIDAAHRAVMELLA